MSMNMDAAIRIKANVQGGNAIQAFNRNLKGLDSAAKLSGAELGRMNIAINRMAREAGNTTAGLRQHIAALQQLRDRVEIGSKAYNRLGTEIQGLQGKLAGLDGSTKAAAAGFKGLGATAMAALAPFIKITAAIGILTTGFKTLSQQEFAEAKVRTLGTNSDELVTSLREVSKELNGQASVAELTGAAYDVASAGFSKAADAAKVLKAASLGAVGGFSDLNTVGNATTSVLNAYQLSADQAGRVVDQFIQTQNDGKIVVAEYAENIGKVAAAAAGLNVPLSEVNAVIAQSTASGVKAEVAFTGLKSALARLASGQANKTLEEFGIKIDAGSIASEGLFKTLQKLQGLDTGTLFKVLGTEAAPALLPIIQNLERYEELVKNQENSTGAAAKAQAEAANTIQGAWKQVTTAFQNFFSNQSSAGELIKVTLQGAAVAIDLLSEALNRQVAFIKFMIKPILDLGKAAMDIAKNTGLVDFFMSAKAASENLEQELPRIWDQMVSDIVDALSPITDTWNQLSNGLKQVWAETTSALSLTWDNTANGISSVAGSLWSNISSGAQGIIAPISNAFQSAFRAAKQWVENFWNSLPQWLRNGLSTAGDIASGVVGAVQGAAGRVVGAFGNTAGPAASAAAGTASGAGTPMPVISASGAGGSSGGGSSGSKRAAKEAVDLSREELAYRTQMIDARREGNKLVEAALQFELDMLDAAKMAETPNKQRLAFLEAEARYLQAEIDYAEEAGKAVAKDFIERQRLAQQFNQTMEDLQVKAGLITGEKLKELEINREVAQILERFPGLTQQQIDKIRELVTASKEGKTAMDALKEGFADVGQALGDTLMSAFDNLINKTQSWKDFMSNALKQVGSMLMKLGLNMLGGSDGKGILSFLGFGFEKGGIMTGGGPANLKKYSRGGIANSPQLALFGEGSQPEAYVPLPDGRRIPVAMQGPSGGNDRMRDVMGASPAAAAPQVLSMSFETTNIGGVEYVSRDQLEQAMAQTRRQAANDGARRGMGMTLDKLQQSPSTRSRVGIR
jgi:TP901 family phage tail tape measure protein